MRFPFAKTALPPPAFADDKALVAACRMGKRAYQEELYNRHAGPLLALCQRLVGDKAQAHDLLQDSFIAAFAKLDQYRGDGSLAGWLRAIVRNTCLTYLRRAPIVYEPSLEDQPNLAPVQPEVWAHYSAAELHEAIAQLPEGYRTVFTLYALEGYSHEAIAEALSISIGTSKSQLARARARLQVTLKKRELQYEIA